MPAFVVAWTAEWYRFFFYESAYSFGKLILGTFFIIGLGIFSFYLCANLKKVSIWGNELVVSNFLKEIRIPLDNIEYVDNSDISTLNRITIVLRNSTIWGDRIIFSPRLFEGKRTFELLKSKTKPEFKTSKYLTSS